MNEDVKGVVVVAGDKVICPGKQAHARTVAVITGHGVEAGAVADCSGAGTRNEFKVPGIDVLGVDVVGVVGVGGD